MTHDFYDLVFQRRRALLDQLLLFPIDDAIVERSQVPDQCRPAVGVRHTQGNLRSFESVALLQLRTH